MALHYSFFFNARHHLFFQTRHCAFFPKNAARIFGVERGSNLRAHTLTRLVGDQGSAQRISGSASPRKATVVCRPAATRSIVADGKYVREDSFSSTTASQKKETASHDVSLPAMALTTTGRERSPMTSRKAQSFRTGV